MSPAKKYPEGIKQCRTGRERAGRLAGCQWFTDGLFHGAEKTRHVTDGNRTSSKNTKRSGRASSPLLCSFATLPITSLHPTPYGIFILQHILAHRNTSWEVRAVEPAGCSVPCHDEMRRLVGHVSIAPAAAPRSWEDAPTAAAAASSVEHTAGVVLPPWQATVGSISLNRLCKRDKRPPELSPTPTSTGHERQ